MKLNTIAVLQNLIAKHRNAETYEQPEIAAEIREYALTDALADLAAFLGTDDAARDFARIVVDAETDATLPQRLAGLIKGGKARARERRADTREAEAQDAADLLARTAVRVDEGYLLDLAYLAEACKGVKTLWLATEGGDAKPFDAARVAELLRVLKGQKVATLAAHMVKDHVRSIEHVESAGYGRKRKVVARTEESRVQGWGLIVTWTRRSGSRGVMRFASTFMASTVTMAVAHIGRAANDVAA